MSRLHELTHLQRQFADEHQETVLRFLSRMRLPVEDYYDIVIFGYLQAVQEYDENPALSRFQFDTIAWTKMSDCLGKHYAYANRPKRKAPTVSTYAYTKDGLTCREIAEIFSTTVHGINGRFRRMRIRLAEMDF